jgi:srtC, putative
MNNNIIKGIEEIKDFLIKYKDEDDLSIGTGLLSRSLFLYNYASFFEQEKVLDISLNSFKKVYNQLEKNLHNSSLVTGCTGCVWLYLYLCKEGIFDMDDKFVEFFDWFYINGIKIEKKKENYDLFYGFLGYSCYFLMKESMNISSKDQLNFIVDVIEDISKKDTNGYFWVDKYGGNYVNLGMAHGLPSIVSFLGKVYNITAYEKAKHLGENAIRWILNHRISQSEKWLYPNRINLLSYDNKEEASRLAWCYGDLGIGYALCAFGQNVKDNKIKNEGIDILNHTILRGMEDTETGIHDKGFCHGVSGVYYIYKKLNDILEGTFKQAEEYWLEKLTQDYKIESFYSYTYYEKQYKYAPDIGLINGFGGIGMTLLSIINKDKKNEWDNIFML